MNTDSLTEILISAENTIDVSVLIGGLLVGENQEVLLSCINRGVKVRFLFPSINSQWLEEYLRASSIPPHQYEAKIVVNSGIARSMGAEVRFHASPVISWFVIVDNKIVASKPIAFYEEALPVVANADKDVQNFIKLFEMAWEGSSTYIQYRSIHTDQLKLPERIFLCHSSADKPQVRTIYQRLVNDGFRPWLDEKEILPGQDWNLEINKALKSSDFLILFLSKGSVSKSGYLQKELRMAVEIALEQPEGKIFLVPAKIEECEPPFSLSGLQYVNLFEADGYEKLIRSLRSRR